MYAHWHPSFCLTLLWAAWLCLPGDLLTVTRRPCLGPPGLTLLQDKQVQVSWPLVHGASAPAPDILVGLHWTCPISSMSFLYQVAQNWRQYSRCHLRRAEKWGNGHSPWCTGHAALDTAQGAVFLAGCMGTQQAHSRDAPPPQASAASIYTGSK